MWETGVSSEHSFCLSQCLRQGWEGAGRAESYCCWLLRSVEAEGHPAGGVATEPPQVAAVAGRRAA